uniref:Immunoglobulin kappa constant n=1 Tax=Sphenodon punctatus TaxID=8508 RepID=A0A8D0GJE6_SPHPU
MRFPSLQKSGFSPGSNGDIVMTQTQESLTMFPGETVTIRCKASENLIFDSKNGLYWFQTKPGQCSGSGSGTEYTFTISRMEANDAGDYYGQQVGSAPLPQAAISGGGTKLEIKRRENAVPSGLIFQPSAEQLEGGQATVVCLVSGFYPSALNVVWKVDGTAKSDGVLTSSKQTDSDNTYSLSSTLSLTKQQYEAHDLYTCEITHVTLSQPLAKSFKRSECTA